MLRQQVIDGVTENNCKHRGITVFILKSYIHLMLYITQIMTHFLLER